MIGNREGAVRLCFGVSNRDLDGDSAKGFAVVREGTIDLEFVYSGGSVVFDFDFPHRQDNGLAHGFPIDLIGEGDRGTAQSVGVSNRFTETGQTVKGIENIQIRVHSQAGRFRTHRIRTGVENHAVCADQTGDCIAFRILVLRRGVNHRAGRRAQTVVRGSIRGERHINHRIGTGAVIDLIHSAICIVPDAVPDEVIGAADLADQNASVGSCTVLIDNEGMHTILHIQHRGLCAEQFGISSGNIGSIDSDSHGIAVFSAGDIMEEISFGSGNIKVVRRSIIGLTGFTNALHNGIIRKNIIGDKDALCHGGIAVNAGKCRIRADISCKCVVKDSNHRALISAGDIHDCRNIAVVSGDRTVINSLGNGIASSMIELENTARNIIVGHRHVIQRCCTVTTEHMGLECVVINHKVGGINRFATV